MAFTLTLLTGVAVASALAVQARRAEAMAAAKRVEAENQTAKAELFAADNFKLHEVYMAAAEEAEIRNAGARLDADLLECKSDPRVGLLRLARPLKDHIGPLVIDFPSGKETHWQGFENEPEFVKLREFQAAAVITSGQDFVPLVPPLHISAGHDFPSEELRYERSPDRRLYAIHSFRVGVSLWSLPTFARVGLLREKDERVLRYGFTPDSRTVWTQDSDSVVRFWNTDGSLRAKTPLRPDRFVYPPGMTHKQLEYSTRYDGPNRLTVADGVAILQSRQVEWVWETGNDGKPTHMVGKRGTASRDGPIEVYSTHTGQFVRRLDRPGRRLAFGSNWMLSPDKRWLYTIVESDSNQQVLILSTGDGRELAHLDHPGGGFLRASISPNGQWVLTYYETERNSPRVPAGSVLLWRCSDWQQVKDDTLSEAIARMTSFLSPAFITDDILALWHDNGIGEGLLQGVMRIGKPGSWTPSTSRAFDAPDWYNSVTELGGALIRSGPVLWDANTLQRLKPSPGRKYAAEFAKLTADGRFWGSLDTVTERVLPDSALFEERNYVEGGLRVLFSPADCEGRYFPGYGHVGVTRAKESFELRILPDPKRLTIPPAMLELWAQLVVGGELTPEGTFQPWDEPTWQAKQRELAALKPPYADFPFPGWAATEPHLWWLIRATQQKNDAEYARLMNDWWQRSGRKRPGPAAPDTWRTK
jgi:hypothetical protein